MLMAAGIPLPKHVFVHGFLLIGKDKMGKSAGNAIDPFKIMDEYGTDALRFYLMREVSFGHDGAVSEEGFRARYESELANDFGNLASRTIAMVHRYRDGVVPGAELDGELAAELDSLSGEVCELLDRADLTGAGDAIWLRVRRLNRYVEERAPWTLAKDPERAGELDAVLASLAEGLRVVGVLLHPWLPESVDKLLAALDSPQTDLECARMQAGRLGAISKLEPLFPKPR
jgi:methionyl-tRNA synthetase